MNKYVRIAMVVTLTLFFMSGCAQHAPYVISTDVYGSSKDSIIEANKARGEIYKYQRYHASENIADSENYIAQRSIEKVYLDQMKTAAIADASGIIDINELQKSLKAVQKNWPQNYGYTYSQQGQRRRMLRLNIKNTTSDYVVRFPDPPFNVIGELGPGEISDYPINIMEGSHNVRFLWIRTGRYYYNRWREKDLTIFIERGRMKPIEIYY